jgi:DNA excision repair protein ERCC-4
VQKFESSIRRENEAFESLIRQKSLMMIPVDQVVFHSVTTLLISV